MLEVATEMSKEKRAAIYLRVSTNTQDVEMQRVQLQEYAERRGWAVHKVYTDRGQSGARPSRPALDELMADCRQRRVDVVLVWKFDRFARSLRQLVGALEEFKRLKVDFVSCTEAIDTSIPSGELVFHIFGAIAQFERALISERVKAGIEHARRQGKKLGRPANRQLTPGQVERLRRERMNGDASLRSLAHKYKVSVWAVHTLCKRLESRV